MYFYSYRPAWILDLQNSYLYNKGEKGVIT